MFERLVAIWTSQSVHERNIGSVLEAECNALSEATRAAVREPGVGYQHKAAGTPC
jgi:hypothetical protein